MTSEQIFNWLKQNNHAINKHFSLEVKVDYFDHAVLGESYQLRFIINDGNFSFTGHTLAEAFQNYLDFDNDIGKHFDKEIEVEGYGITDAKLFCLTLDNICDMLAEAKQRQQLKMAI